MPDAPFTARATGRTGPEANRSASVVATFHHLIGSQADQIAWWQMCIRAGIVFLYGLVLYRVMPRRAFGSTAAADIVVVVVMGSSLSRALTGNAPLLPTLAATATLAALYMVVTELTRRSALLSRLIKGRPLQIVCDGRIDWHALHHAELGERDLTETLRMRGIADVEQVEAAYLERNGRISVVRKD